MHESTDAVVIGAGPAGIAAAEHLREAGHTGGITVLSAEDHLPYDRPPLSKEALLDDAAPEAFPLRPEAFYDEYHVALRLGCTAVRIDRAAGAVDLADGDRVPAGAVVLCTGGRPRTVNLPGADLGGVHTLRTVEDAAAIRARLERGGPVVVVGGGFIGTEVAAAAATRGCPTVLVESADLPLGRVLGSEVAGVLAGVHRERGVELRTGVAVTGFAGNGRVERVELADGSRLAADLVVVGLGMAPSHELAATAGLAVGDGVHVDDRGRTSAPGIWAAGDVAATPALGNGRQRTEHWTAATQLGVRVARDVLGLPPEPPTVPWFWSDQFDLNIQLAGAPGRGPQRCVRGDVADLCFSVLYHDDGLVTGITAVNRGRDVRPATDLIRSGTRVDPDSLDDPATTLKALARAARCTR